MGLAQPEIRNAATVVLYRHMAGAPHVLMGTRGAKAAFMPSKVVFPGGAVEAQDYDQSVGLSKTTQQRLRLESTVPPEALVTAGLRELWEETGQIIDPAKTHEIAFIFRALTPPGQPRRFDARFLWVPATALQSNPDVFEAATNELSGLTWVPLGQADAWDVPFITRVVLAEARARLAGRQGPVPFIDNLSPQVRYLG